MIQNWRNGSVLLALMLAGCGGATDKPAENASSSSESGSCAPGEVKEAGECVPVGGSSGSSSSSSSSSSGSSESASTGGGSTESAGAKVPYDKDNVHMVLKRAAVQVKMNCGAATDSNGKAAGPWGDTKVSVTLGRNGHVHGVTIPAPFDGQPTGRCAVLAFENLIFPPYPAPADVTVDWDIQIVKPGGK
jgi:hypothetical protein